MNSSAATMNDFLHHVSCLFDSSGSSDISDRWLRNFQTAPTAWAVAVEVLKSFKPGNSTSPSASAAHTAANLIRSKLLVDWEDFSSAGDRQALRLALMDSLKEMTEQTGKNTAPIKSRLALSVACCAVLSVSDGEWSDSFPDLARNFSGSPGRLAALLEVLGELPEELENSRLNISEERRDRARVEFQRFGPALLSLLCEVFDQVGLRGAALECASNWLSRRLLSARAFARHAILQKVLDVFSVPSLTEGVCDLLGALLRAESRQASQENPQEGEALMEFLIPRIFSLLPRFHESLSHSQTPESPGYELVRKFSFLFVDLGECRLEVFLKGGAFSAEILSLIATCAHHNDYEIAANTFDFWYKLSLALESRGSPEARKFLAPAYAALIPALHKLMKFPLDYPTLDDEAREELKKRRYFSAEALLEGVAVLGASESLRIIMQLIEQEFKLFQADRGCWPGLESSLHCFRSIARRVEDEEIPQIGALLEILPALAHERPCEELQYTAILIVGRYSGWLARHPEKLESLMSFVVSGLNRPATTSAAALAFKHLCEKMPDHFLLSHLDGLVSVYQASAALHALDRLEIIEGCALIASKLANDKIFHFVQKICDPIVQKWQNAAANENAGRQALSQAEHRDLQASFDLFTRFLYSLDPQLNSAAPELVQRSVAGLIQSLWPLLDRLSIVVLPHEGLAEQICKIVRFSLKLCEKFFAPLLRPAVALAANRFLSPPHHSCFLYVLAVACDQFGRDAEFPALVGPLSPAIAKISCQALASLQGHTERPDLSEDAFELFSRLLVHCPAVLFNLTEFAEVLRSAVAGMAVDHRDAATAVHRFLGIFLTMAIDEPKENAKRAGPPQPQLRAAVLNSFQTFQWPFASSAMLALSGAFSYSRLPLLLISLEPAVKLISPAFFLAAARTLGAPEFPHEALKIANSLNLLNEAASLAKTPVVQASTLAACDPRALPDFVNSLFVVPAPSRDFLLRALQNFFKAAEIGGRRRLRQ